jgi:hypothetical protein
VTSLTRVVHDAIQDRRVRSALDDTVDSARRVYAEVRGSEPRNLAARAVRDERLQTELAAVARSAARTFDVGLAVTGRRARRRFAMVAAILGGAVALAGIRRRLTAGESAQPGDARGLDDAVNDDHLTRTAAAPAAVGPTGR